MSSLTAVDLGLVAAGAAMERSGIDAGSVSEVVFGNARPAGTRPNPARQIAVRAGVPVERPAYTLNQACGSGLLSIINGLRSILLGDATVVVAGGTESMSNVPYLLTNVRWGQKMGHDQILDSMYLDGYLCPICDQLMGETAETLADQYKISRTAQDEFAAASQNKCEAARKSGRFDSEIVPVDITDRKGNVTRITTDEHPRDGVTVEGLSKLPPVFRKNGTVHAGNASGITDGAAAVVLMSEEAMKELKVKPLARIAGYDVAGVSPEVMGLGPVPATQKLLKKTGVKLEEIDLIELNEAFAAQVLACDRELLLDPKKLNVNGGAIALGHPTACTGSRITATLVHEMKKRKSVLGMATLCVSGGLGISMLVENCE